MTQNTKLKIGEFRSAVDSLNWSRNDLSGATSDEFVRMDVRSRLKRHINIVQEMIDRVPARFAADIEHAREAIASAEGTIARWTEKASYALPKFVVTFEDAGFTDSEEVCEAEFTEDEALGFTQVSRSEGTFPPLVLAVVRGYVEKDEGQDEEDMKAFAGVVLIVSARDEAHALQFAPPSEFLTRISDVMTSVDGNCPLALEGSWEVLEAETASAELLQQYGVPDPKVPRTVSPPILVTGGRPAAPLMCH